MVIAEYIRLSQADRDVMKKENKTESEGIAHQRDLIRGYIQSHTDLKDCEIREFYDDGYSGTNFRRPAFERLLEQIKKGAVNCVIVKDGCVIIEPTQKGLENQGFVAGSICF